MRSVLSARMRSIASGQRRTFQRALNRSVSFATSGTGCTRSCGVQTNRLGWNGTVSNDLRKFVFSFFQTRAARALRSAIVDAQTPSRDKISFASPANEPKTAHSAKKTPRKRFFFLFSFSLFFFT